MCLGSLLLPGLRHNSSHEQELCSLQTTKHAKKRPSPHRPLFSPSALQFSSKEPGKLPGAFTSHPDNMPIPAKSDKAYQGEAPASSVNYLLDYFVLSALFVNLNRVLWLHSRL